MNANSRPPVSISKWLRKATTALQNCGIATARLDSLVLLADELAEDKGWLLAHSDHELSANQQTALQQKLTRRINREPLAYIRGKQEFFGRDFVVNANVLIPRPETELLIEQLLTLPRQPEDSVLDVGTGSGAIAITISLELPSLQVTATDISESALAVARQNAAALGAQVTFIKQDLLKSAQSTYAFIVANLPYVAADWQRSAETAFEPALALFAEDDGLSLIQKLLSQSTKHLQPHGWLLLEADPRQHARLIEIAQLHGFQLYSRQDFILILRRA